MPSTAISAQNATVQISTGTGGAKNITAIALGFPTILTIAAHGFSNGDVEVLAGIVGTTVLNGQTVTVKNKTTNTIAIDVDTTGGAAYVSGGTATPNTYTNVKNVKSFTPPAQAATELDLTNLDSVNKETIPGLIDPSSLSMTVDIDYTDAGQQAVRAANAAGLTKNWKINMPNGKVISFSGWVKKFDTGSGAVDAVSKSNLEIRLTTIPVIA